MQIRKKIKYSKDNNGQINIIYNIPDEVYTNARIKGEPFAKLKLGHPRLFKIVKIAAQQNAETQAIQNQTNIDKAKADAEAKVTAAQGDADAKVIAAQAEADANAKIKAQKKTLPCGSVFLCMEKRKIKIISYFKCKK